MKNRNAWLIPGVIIAFLLVIICSSCIVITYPNEYSVIKQFGQVVSIRDNKDGESGLSFKLPFIQSVTKVPNTRLLYDLAISDVITKDKKTMVEDSFVIWSIDDPMAYIRTLNGSGAAAESRIDVNVYNAIKNTISNTTQADVISGRNGDLVASIKHNVGDSLVEYGINLLAVETKHLDLPDSNKQSVYSRMISERNQIAAGYTATGQQQAQEIRNSTSREVSITLSSAKAQAEQIIAEGEATYMQILADAYNDPDKAEFYNFVRALDAAKLSLTGSGNNVLYLTPDSPLAAIFYQAETAPTDVSASAQTQPVEAPAAENDVPTGSAQ
ncbi:MAG: protease modulator HflC [Lachnospiraceae bacterium]|nr:protease modulator HflC [Lachnospiraceae bacterium]